MPYETADYDNLIGKLAPEFAATMPWNVFVRVAMYINGPVLHVYDIGVSETEPVYVVNLSGHWPAIKDMIPGEAFFMGGMTIHEAKRHVMASDAPGKPDA